MTKLYQHIIFMPEGEENASIATINRRNLGIVNEILEMVPVNNSESTNLCVIYTDGEVAVLPERWPLN